MAGTTRDASIGLVTVRVGSSRLNRKCLLEFGDGNVLEHVLRRARTFGFVPLVATTDKPDDDVVERIAYREGCRCFRGSEEDKLLRWRDACRANGVDDFHTIDADDPFFDGDLGHASLQLLRQGRHDIVYPAKSTYLASVGYSLTRDIVERACAVKTTSDTEMMWYHIERLPGVRAAALDVANARIRDVRLTLDYEEDYWLLRSVLRILGPFARRTEIEDLFLRSPDLAAVNWFRNEAWKAGQEAKRL
jgi:spore coat polysaccharide biosynthesis protein SpsF